MASPFSEDARRPVGHVVERDVATGLAMGDPGLRGDRQPLVHGAALIGLVSGRRRSSAAFRGQKARHRRATCGNIVPVAGVEQQRLVGQ